MSDGATGTGIVEPITYNVLKPPFKTSTFRNKSWTYYI